MRHKPLIAAMVSVATAFIVVLTVGDMTYKKFASTPDWVFGAIAAIALVAIAAGMYRLLLGQGFGPEKSDSARAIAARYKAANPARERVADPEREARLKQAKEESARQEIVYHERKRVQIAKLRADPSRYKYAALVERGEEWSDEQIAYHEDQNLTATCPHLEPVERGMRLAGILPKLVWQWWLPDPAALRRIKADCCINVPELKRMFTFPESVRYQEGYQPERHPQDNPWATLSCSECVSVMELVHSEWPRAATKWFPVKGASE